MTSPDTVLRARALLREKTVQNLPDAAAISKRGDADDRFFAGMLEAAFLVAAADGELSKEEVGSLIDVVTQMGEGVTPSELAGMFYEFTTALDREGRPARIAALASHVTEAAARREILGFAALVALCDGDLAPSELFVVHSIAKAFDLDTATANGIVRSIATAMGVSELGK